MYKLLKIKNREYKLEYTVRASLYEDCIETMVNLFGSVAGIMTEDSMTKDLNPNDKLEVQKSLMEALRRQVYGLPNITLTLFYAGLMEYHGTGRNGDGTIRSKDDAESLVYDYFEDHKDDGLDTFADILSICVSQMQEDGFFRRVGIEKLLSQGEETEKTEEKKKPNRATRRATAKDTKK